MRRYRKEDLPPERVRRLLEETIHYRGDGQFMVSGRQVSRRSAFLPEMLLP